MSSSGIKYEIQMETTCEILKMQQHPNDKQFDLASGKIFVFGSNLEGIHGAGAALFALKHCGALRGKAAGKMNQCYAIPTKDEYLQTLSLESIENFVTNFVAYARAHPEMEFFVTRVGCGLAGYSDKDIAPMFKDAPSNCELPIGWDKPETLT